MSYEFMTKAQWDEIYDIARYNGIAVHQLLNEIHAKNPLADESEIYYACKQWSKDRTKYPALSG